MKEQFTLAEKLRFELNKQLTLPGLSAVKKAYLLEKIEMLASVLGKKKK